MSVCLKFNVSTMYAHVSSLTTPPALSDLRSLYGLSGLTSLVLDCNEVTSHTTFPAMPHLEVLWVNKNKIVNLSIFVESISPLFPNLRQLCMMNNPAAPSYFNGGSKQEYLDYR